MGNFINNTKLFYTIILSNFNLPESLQSIFKLNPLYIYINASREIILNGTMPTPLYLLACFGSASIMLIIGLFVFRKKQNKFVYYL